MMVTVDDSPPERFSGLKATAAAAVAGLVAIFGVGVIVGVIVAATETGRVTLPGVAALIFGLVLAIGSAIVAWRNARSFFRSDEPQSVRKSRGLMIWAGLLGAMIGVALAIGGLSGPGEIPDIGLFSDGPIPRTVAIMVIAALCVVPLISIAWHRSIDEHEAAAYRFASMIALYTYFFVSVVWWLAWRGGMLVAPDGVAIFWVVMIVWTVVWAVRRYR